jgi:4'-phosphopantetheinyl transferase
MVDRRTVHLWYGSIRAHANQADQFHALLEHDERQRATQFRFDRHRLDYVICRGLLRLLISHYLPLAPEQVAFQYGPHGKPKLHASCQPTEEEPAVCFNLAHAADRVLFGFSRGRELGVDVEELSAMPDTEEIAQRFFSPPERAWLTAGRPEERAHRFFVLWTRKEAFLKAIGSGISRSLSDFDVSGTPDGLDGALPVRQEGETDSRWYLRQVPVHPGYAAAVCSEGVDWDVACFALDRLIR